MIKFNLSKQGPDERITQIDIDRRISPLKGFAVATAPVNQYRGFCFLAAFAGKL